MTTERSGNCKACGKQIRVKGNKFNQLLVDELFRIKSRWHWLTNHAKLDAKTLSQIRWFVVDLISIPFEFAAQILLLLAIAVTYPFWFIHEILTRW